MRSVLTSSNDVTQMMKSFMKTILEGTASIANEHERALDLTSNRFETRMVGVHDMVAETEVKLAEMKALVVVNRDRLSRILIANCIRKLLDL
jgi:hypothetical protein